MPSEKERREILKHASINFGKIKGMAKREAENIFISKWKESQKKRFDFGKTLDFGKQIDKGKKRELGKALDFGKSLDFGKELDLD